MFLRRMQCVSLDRVLDVRVSRCDVVGLTREALGRATRRRHHEARTELWDVPHASSVVSGLGESSWAWGRVMADVRVVGLWVFFLSVTGLVGALGRTTSVVCGGDERPFV